MRYMCGIIGYIGKKPALPFIMEGLQKESYRGYDSSGLVIFDGAKTHYVRSVGKLKNLQQKLRGMDLRGSIGLGHNRWATHGGVTQANAHPHADCAGNIFVVHNGIIENYQDLKTMLQNRGHRFLSQTDTEVISHLIEHFFKGNLEQAVAKALAKVRGAYAIAVIAKTDPGKMVAARLSAPLVICSGRAGGFVASDPAAINSHTKSMVFLDDNEMAVMTKNSYVITDRHHNKKEKTPTRSLAVKKDSQKGDYPHFLIKEIMEQPQSLANALRGRLLIGRGNVKLGGLDAIAGKLKKIENVQIVACGSAACAGLAGEYMLEEFAGMGAKAVAGSELRYKKAADFTGKKTLYVVISQSGETADTLYPLQEIKKAGGLALGIVNVAGSTIARQVDAGIYIHAGAETAVVATKSFIGQLAAMVMLTVFLGRQRKVSAAKGRLVVRGLSQLPALMEKVLLQKNHIRRLAKKYQKHSGFFVIGRKYGFPVAKEGAIKLQETAQVHAQGLAAGELKHGPIALIDRNFLTIAVVLSDPVYDKMISSIREIKARGGKVIAIATEGNTEINKIVDDVIYIPKTQEMLAPILAAVPFQLLAYYLGLNKGYDVDQPRNLAKSVTVE